jgi:spermidine synthase
MSERAHARQGTLPLLCALFVLSGAAGLVLETVLLRQLALLFGNSALATALVLAAFMGGLAAGSALFGPRADRTARPLRLYGLLEWGVGLSGAALVWLLGSGRQIFLAPLRLLEPGAGQHAAELALAFGLVLVPTLLMGGTLPAVSRFVIRDASRLAGSLGLLYGLNTLGASAGVFLAGFILVERFGVSRTAYVAAAFNVLAGCGALLLDRRSAGPSASRDRVTPPGKGGKAAAGESTEGEPVPPLVRQACLGVAALGGAIVLGYEVVWTRLLSLPMRSFSYSFSLMLSLFLLGLVLGALLLPVVAGRIRDAAAALGWVQLAMGLYVAASLLWLPALLTPSAASSFGAFLAKSALRAALVVLPPTILSGIALPLAVRGFSGGAGRIGRDVGVVFALNTAGAICGALAAGLLLLPRLGAPLSLAALAAANAFAGLLLFAALHRPAWRMLAAGTAILLCIAPAATISDRFVEAFLRASRGGEKAGELLLFHEGATDTIAIVRKEYGFHDPQAKSLITNGVAMSATVKPVWRYMAAEGHLPVLFAEEPRAALHVGVGTGITLGAVASHRRLDSIVAVELSEGVIAGLPLFETENDAVLSDPRVCLVRDDGRHHLELTSERFDLITVEPPPPIVAGSVHLYSLDFYRLCRERLRPGGIVAQWLPLHAQSLLSARMTARTFLEAFPHVQLWLPSVRDAVLVGSAEPLVMDLDRLIEVYGEPRSRANLDRAYLESPEALLATFLLDGPGLERWTTGAPVITDERPLMEFFRHQGGNMKDRDIAGLLAVPQSGRSWLRGLDDHPELAAAVQRENHALRLYAESTVFGEPRAGVAAARLARGTEFFLYGFGCAGEQLERLLEEGGTGGSSSAAAGQLQRCRALTGVPASLPRE